MAERSLAPVRPQGQDDNSTRNPNKVMRKDADEVKKRAKSNMRQYAKKLIEWEAEVSGRSVEILRSLT